MRQKTLANHDAAKAAAQYLLCNGLASYAEIATLSGRSRQIIHHWAKELGTEEARTKHLAKLWRNTMRRNE